MKKHKVKIDWDAAADEKFSVDSQNSLPHQNEFADYEEDPFEMVENFFGIDPETGEIDYNSESDYTIIGYEQIFNFLKDGEDNQFLSSTIMDFNNKNLTQTPTVEQWNQQFGWSLSTKNEHKDKLVIVIYSKEFQVDELIIELVKHPTDDDGLILLSTYAPAEVDFSRRLDFIADYLKYNYMDGKYHKVYLQNDQLIMENHGSVKTIRDLFEKPHDELTDDDVLLITEIMTEFNLLIYFPIRSLMMMFNLANSMIGNSDNAKIIKVQTDALFSGEFNKFN